MKLLQSLVPTLGRLGGKPAQPSVQLTFSPPLSTALKQELSTLPPTTPLSLTASNAAGTQATLTLPSGAVITATVNPAIPQGAQVQLNPAELLNASVKPAPENAPQQPNLPTGTPTQSVAARVVMPQSAGVTAPQPAQQPAPTPQSVLVQSENSPITHNALRTIHTTTVLQVVAQTTAQNIQNVAQAAQTVITAQATAPQPTLPVPPGPVAVTLPANLAQTLMGQVLTLTPSMPMAPDGTQQATLTPANPVPGQPAQRVPVTLNLGVSLAVAKPQPAILLPPAPSPATPQQTAAPQPVLILTGNQTMPSLPQTPHPQLIIQQPPAQTPPAQPAAPLPAAQPQAATEAPLPIAARILPPQAGQPATQHTALLATGTTITLQSPQPLATGSIIVADFPITPTAGVQRVLPAESQTQQQPNTTAQAQGAQAVPQTARAALAPGMLITGVVTGQNEQGQPLLTITQPGALAGATVPLTLAEPTTLLPVGAQLNIRVENNLLATILGLTLPQTAQNAFTVNTLGSRWDGLQQALAILQQQAPTQAANMRASLPQLANLLPGLIQFTNALRTNKAEDAFDTAATRLLKSMGIDLSSDIAQLSQLQQRPAAQDPQWRGTLFPYVEAPNEDPRQGGFFWRREKSDDPRGSTTTRFVVEVEMSQVGAMQLDGLVTYPDIWLKLRRTSHPEEGFTEGLQAMVNTMLGSAGLNGGITVETTSTFPVNPRAELLAQTENPLPTTA